LSEDAQGGISDIEHLLKFMNMTTKTGKEVPKSSIAKVARYDKWVVGEILDYINNTDNNPDNSGVDKMEVIQEIKDTDKEQPPQVDPAIDIALKGMFDSDQKEYNFEEIKSNSKAIYDIVFNTYNREEENGLVTSNFSLLEKEKNSSIFVINKA